MTMLERCARAVHFFLCHVLWFDHAVQIVHQPTRQYRCKACGHVYRDQFLER